MFCLSISAQSLTANQLDSLYIKFLSLRSPELLSANERPVELKLEDRKCGMELVNTVKFNLLLFSESQQKILKPLVNRPSLQDSILSASGKFWIHFNSTGTNVPHYISNLTPLQNAQLAAEAIDSVYRFEVEYLDYPPAPSDNGAGGDDRFDIYITYQGGGLYGATYFENEIGSGSNKFTSYMEVDNAYIGYYSSGIDGLEVTLAHEFHHAIQGGNYIVRLGKAYEGGDTYFYELTSTSMEDFVYGDVNDYVAYLGTFFSNPDTPMPLHNGYDFAIWNKFLKERFGFDIIKQQWEMMPDFRAINAINNSIFNNNSSLPKEMNKFGIWTFYTNYRSITGQYFDDAELYPLINVTELSIVNQPVNVEAGTIANQFLFYRINTSNGIDSLFTIVSNGDYFSSVQNPNTTMPYVYTLFTSGTTGERELTDDYSANFNVSNETVWSVSEILNRIIVREDSSIQTIFKKSNLYIFQNPYYYSSNYAIVLAFSGNVGDDVNMEIYSIGMKEMFSSKKPVTIISRDSKTFTGIEWNGRNKNDEKLPTGIYVIVIKSGSEVLTGKIAIFNE